MTQPANVQIANAIGIGPADDRVHLEREFQQLMIDMQGGTPNTPPLPTQPIAPPTAPSGPSLQIGSYGRTT
jgi:hypothetical protein